MTRISVSESGRSSNKARKLFSMSSVTNSGLPSSFVAPINCSKQGWRQAEAIFISLSNKSLLWRDKIRSWICFTATVQPQYVPSLTLPQPPLPRQFSVIWISLREMTQSHVCCRRCSLIVCWANERLNSSSFTSWSFSLSWLCKFSSRRCVSLSCLYEFCCIFLSCFSELSSRCCISLSCLWRFRSRCCIALCCLSEFSCNSFNCLCKFSSRCRISLSCLSKSRSCCRTSLDGLGIGVCTPAPHRSCIFSVRVSDKEINHSVAQERRRVCLGSRKK